MLRMTITATLRGREHDLHVVEAHWIHAKQKWAISIVFEHHEDDHFIGYGATIETACDEAVKVAVEQASDAYLGECKHSAVIFDPALKSKPKEGVSGVCGHCRMPMRFSKKKWRAAPVEGGARPKLDPPNKARA